MIKHLLISAAIVTASFATASAETVRWARAGDSITMDPHAQNEGPTHTLSHQYMILCCTEIWLELLFHLWQLSGRR